MQQFVLDNLNTAVITLDHSLRVLYLNPAAEALFDVSFARIQKQPLISLIDQGDLRSDLNRALSSGHQYTRRETEICMHGETVKVDYSVTPVSFPESCLLVEIYQRDRLQRIAREESLLAKQETSKSMIRGLAHEIKNPLGGIRGAAQLLSRELPDQRLNDFTDVIIQETDRLRDLVNRMLGPLKPPEIVELNIHQVLDRAVQLISAETKGQLKIVRDYDPSIPDIPGDSERLIQAVLNIVRNAMESIKQTMPLTEGVIRIQSRITRQFTIGTQKPRQVCHISVVDNGPGVPAELIDSIFYPMISGRANGTGLGLPLSQSIISQHQGLIECESLADGTTFHIYLPLVHETGTLHNFTKTGSTKTGSTKTGSKNRRTRSMNMENKVWVVDDDRSIRWVLERALTNEDVVVRTFEAAEQALNALKHSYPQVIISDVRMPGMDGLELMKHIHEQHPDLPVIIMTAHSDLDSAVSSYQSGAFEYLPKPFDIDEAVALVKRGIEHCQQQDISPVKEDHPVTEIIGEAPAMQEVFRAIGRLSQSNITVLINGQSGTGKELVAKALHRHSPRASESFIALNMAAIPKDLIESELFGHEKGAFTGAGATRRGRFEQAGGGTLFLDEIGDMPADTQTRLLRVLADGEFYRVGGHTPVKANVRIIAATHQNLEKLVQEGHFREDLFHRLNVIRVHLPKLSERREDIPKLARFFLDQAGKELDVEPKVLHPDTVELIRQLAWPGNVRQLENTCRWLTVMASGREVLVSDLPPELISQTDPPSTQGTGYGNWEQLLKQWCDAELAEGRTGILDRAVPIFEKIMIESALSHTGGRKRNAAELLGWGRNTLTRKLKELNMHSSESI